MTNVPLWFWITVSFLFGISIGSFLNVVIYRLPRGKSLTEPKNSFCPNCGATLTAIDLVPLLSFLALGRRCRRCHKPISWRYFNVELLTGLLFVAMYLRFPRDPANWIALSLFTSVLIPIFFIDLDTFTIPDSLNLLALGIAIARDIYGIATHEAGHELLWGWLPRSILGAVVGSLLFGLVRFVGTIAYKKEAMGLGDPLLSRAMGAMLVSVTPAGFFPLRLFPIWALLACVSGVIVGYPIILRRSQLEQQAAGKNNGTSAENEEENGGDLDEFSTSNQAKELLYPLWLGDLRDYFKYRNTAPPESEEDFIVAPTAIPFGPFLVIGFLLTVFCGEWITAAYLA